MTSALAVEPNDLQLFAHVVEAGSLSRAAERLGVPKSTVSRRLTTLEKELGERLVLRTTRKMTVTDFGLAVLDHARHVVESAEAASALAQNRQAEPSGRLRVTMPGDLANVVLAPFLAAFSIRYPAITLEIDLSPRFVDLIGENVDVAIRVGHLRDDASLAARRIAEFTSSLYAAPAYLARHGAPAEPAALAQHQALQVLSRTGDPMPWVLHRGEQRWQGAVSARTLANSPEVLMRMALRGAGITMVHDAFAVPFVQSGELVAVLPDWHLAPATVWAVFPGRRLVPARTRVFIDGLVAALSSPECAAAGASVRRIVGEARQRSAMRKGHR